MQSLRCAKILKHFNISCFGYESEAVDDWRSSVNEHRVRKTNDEQKRKMRSAFRFFLYLFIGCYSYKKKKKCLAALNNYDSRAIKSGGFTVMQMKGIRPINNYLLLKIARKIPVEVELI